MPSTLNDKTLSLAPGARVDLFDLDLTDLGGPMLRVTPNRHLSVPERVLLMQDNKGNSNTAVQHGGVFPVTQGQRVAVEGYFRTASGNSSPSVTIHPDGLLHYDGSSLRVRLNPENNTPSIVMNGAATSQGSAVMSQAGEFSYFRISFVWDRDVPMRLTVFPAQYAADGASGGVATGAIHLADLTVTTLDGGSAMRLPLSMEPADWSHVNSADAPVERVDPINTITRVPVWRGFAYTPIPIAASGFETSGQGAFPRPKLQMSNLFQEGSALAQEFGDLRGATVTRRRVFADNLDNGPFPDPMASYPPDIFVVDSKSRQDATIIEWTLASVLDQQGVILPNRQILRDTCQWVYRRWDGSKFVYAAENGCPYTGAAMYDDTGAEVSNPENDRCSHKLKTGCRRRFGMKQPLPFGAFPMVGRIR